MKISLINMALYFLLSVILMTGCATTNTQKSSTSIPPVTRLSFDQLTTYVGQQQGKPLLVNFWATWCEPCVEELPDLIELYHAHHKEGLEMVGFSVDFPEQTDTVVKTFIKAHNIPYPVYVANPDDQDVLINHFSKKWSGAVPATFLYDKTGRLVRMRLGKMTYREMEEFIKPILSTGK
jgi:thiol-disulfide isomerase/thioredoxin